MCVLISRNIIKLELPNFSQTRTRSAFSLAVFIGMEFSDGSAAKKPGWQRLICLMQAASTALNRLYFLCASRIQPLPSSLPLHISTSLPNRATFCRSACVFGVIAILLRPNTCTTTNHLVNRLRIACPIPEPERTLCKKEDENRCFWVHEGIELHDDGLKFIGIGIMPDGDSKNVLTLNGVSSEVSTEFSKERILQ